MPVSPGSFLSLTTLSETLGYSLLLIRMIFTGRQRTKENRKPRRCRITALPKKIPKEIYVPTEGTIKAEFFGRFAGAKVSFRQITHL